MHSRSRKNTCMLNNEYEYYEWIPQGAWFGWRLNEIDELLTCLCSALLKQQPNTHWCIRWALHWHHGSAKYNNRQRRAIYKHVDLGLTVFFAEKLLDPEWRTMSYVDLVAHEKTVCTCVQIAPVFLRVNLTGRILFEKGELVGCLVVYGTCWSCWLKSGMEPKCPGQSCFRTFGTFVKGVWDVESRPIADEMARKADVWLLAILMRYNLLTAL